MREEDPSVHVHFGRRAWRPACRCWARFCGPPVGFGCGVLGLQKESENGLRWALSLIQKGKIKYNK